MNKQANDPIETMVTNLKHRPSEGGRTPFKYNDDPMKMLEERLGTERRLVDDWNRLGWGFFSLPGTQERCLMLEEYSECKAEGADCVLRAEIIDVTNAEPVEQVSASYKSYAVFRFVSETGGGIHGVPWFDNVFSTMPYGDSGVCLIVETVEGLDALAAKIMQRVRDASRSDYWMMPGYNEPLRHFTWAVDRNGERSIEKDFLTLEEITAVGRGFEGSSYGEIKDEEVSFILAHHDWLNPVKK